MSYHNQARVPASFVEADRRASDIQSDFQAIVYAMGSSRPCLQNRGRWYEACRDKHNEPMTPWKLEDEMISDAVLTVALRGTEAERKAVRAAVVQYYETRCRLSLEMLGETDNTDPVRLTLESNEEVGEAQNAVISALTAQTPGAFDRASRELTEALTPMERLRDLCASRASFITPRTVALFKSAR